MENGCVFGDKMRSDLFLTSALREKDYEVHEEVHGLFEMDSLRRIDTIVFDRSTQKAHFLDPTIQFEK